MTGEEAYWAGLGPEDCEPSTPALQGEIPWSKQELKDAWDASSAKAGEYIRKCGELRKALARERESRKQAEAALRGWLKFNEDTCWIVDDETGPERAALVEESNEALLAIPQEPAERERECPDCGYKPGERGGDGRDK